jgi:hypothetical protein
MHPLTALRREQVGPQFGTGDAPQNLNPPANDQFFDVVDDAPPMVPPQTPPIQPVRVRRVRATPLIEISPVATRTRASKTPIAKRTRAATKK